MENEEVVEIWEAMCRRVRGEPLDVIGLFVPKASDLLPSVSQLRSGLGSFECEGLEFLDEIAETFAQVFIRAACVTGTTKQMAVLTPRGRDDVRAILATACRTLEFMATSGADYRPLPDLKVPQELALAAVAFEAFQGSGPGFLPPRTGGAFH